MCPEEVEPIIKRRFKIQEAIVGKSKNKILDWEPVLVLNKREFYKRKVALGKLKYYLNDFLVNYKIPTKIISLEKLPRTLYGKVDRKKINEIIKSKK